MAAGGSEVARLYASVGADIDSFKAGMTQVDRELKSVAKDEVKAKVGLDTGLFDQGIGKLKTKLGSASGLMQGLVGGIAGGASFAAFNTLSGAITGVFDSMVNGAARMETFQTQFSVLLGSMDAAKQRMAELSEFAKTTPFELPEVVAASRTLQVFTQGALATGEGLRLVGDVASGTGQNFGEVAMWMGRLYDAMQSGRPFGEATMRLQEMGAISGASRAKIEALAAGVKAGSSNMGDAWKEASGEFSRFSGMMVKQSETLEGKWSNLSDALSQKFTQWGTAILPFIKGVVDLSINGVGVLEPLLLAVAVAFGAMAVAALPITGTILAIAAAVAALAVAFQTNFLFIQDIVSGVFTVLGTLAKGFMLTMLDLAEGIANVGASIPGPWQEGATKLKATLEQMQTDVGNWGKLTQEQIAEIKDPMRDSLASGAGEVAAGAQALVNPIPQAVEDAKEKAAAVAARTPGAIAEAIRQRRQDWISALDTLKDDMEHSMSKTAELAALRAALVSKKLAEGLKSNDPVVKLQAQETTKIILDRMVELEGKTAAYGEATMNAYAKGIISARGEVERASLRIASAAGKYLEAGSPPKEGPLAEIAKWGHDTAIAWVLGWDSATGTVQQHVASSMTKVAKTVDDQLEKLKASYEKFQSWLQAYPAATAAGIMKSLNITLGQLSGLWKSLSPSEQYGAIQQAGAQITAAEQAAAMPASTQPLLAEIDRLEAAIAKNLDYASHITGSDAAAIAKRQTYLDKAAEYSHRIDLLREEISRLVQAAEQAAEEAANAASAASEPVVISPDLGSYSDMGSPASYGGGGTTYNVNVGADIDINGPVLDPYGDYAQRLAALLIPGLQRELERQGISL